MRPPVPGAARRHTPEITALAAVERHAAPCQGAGWHAVARKLGTYTARGFLESSKTPIFLGPNANYLVDSNPRSPAFPHCLEALTSRAKWRRVATLRGMCALARGLSPCPVVPGMDPRVARFWHH